MLGAWLGRAPCRIDYVNRPLKNHVRYAKMRKWPLKSAVRYAKTQNRLSPLSSHMTFDAPKCNTYATFFWRLHSLWAPSDFFSPKSIYHSIFGAVNQVSKVNEMGTWNRGPNLVIRARAMRTVRLLLANSLKLYKYLSLDIYINIYIYINII